MGRWISGGVKHSVSYQSIMLASNIHPACCSGLYLVCAVLCLKPFCIGPLPRMLPISDVVKAVPANSVTMQLSSTKYAEHSPPALPDSLYLSCQRIADQLFWFVCRVGIHLPSVTIRFKDLTASATAVSANNALPSIWNSYKGFVVVRQGWTPPLEPWLWSGMLLLS